MLSKNYLVKKTTPLIYAEWLNLGVNELKIVEIYLSRIDVANKNTCVRFTKKDFTELMGYEDVRNLKTKVFDDRLAKFLSQQIKIDLEDGTGFHRFNLFSDAKCYFDPVEGKAVVDIDCNPKLAPVFLELADGKNNGYKYISYRLESTKGMESAYSIRLYNLLLDHAWGNYSWHVDLENLRGLLGATDPSYKSFKYFNARLLKKAQAEINSQTDIEFEYERIVKGRVTKGISFKIKRKKNIRNIVDGEAEEISDKYSKEDSQQQYSNKENEFYAEAMENAFTDIQVTELVKIVKEKIVKNVLLDATAKEELEIYDYIAHYYKSLQTIEIKSTPYHALRDKLLKDYDGIAR